MFFTSTLQDYMLAMNISDWKEVIIFNTFSQFSLMVKYYILLQNEISVLLKKKKKRGNLNFAFKDKDTISVKIFFSSL